LMPQNSGIGYELTGFSVARLTPGRLPKAPNFLPKLTKRA
jgi:hypothetical protein